MKITSRSFSSILGAVLSCAAILPATAQQGVLREVWSNLSGASVSNLTNSPNFPGQPILEVLDEEFASPVDFGNYYGIRMRATLRAPRTGNFTFWVSGDDRCELWLSENIKASDARRIATVPSYTEPQDWKKFEQQQSEPIRLVQGQSYYIEALMKEHGGGDSLSVAWASSPTATPQVITKEYLTPPYVPSTAVPQGLILKAAGDETLHLPRKSTTLAAQVLDTVGSRTPTVSWRKVSGPAATLAAPDSLSTAVELTTAGTYVFEITAVASGNSRTGRTTVTLTNPLHPDAGAALTEYWYNRSNDFASFKAEAAFPNYPEGWALTDNISSPKRVNDYYGSRTSGFILIPATGDYQFYLTGDDQAEFHLDTGSGLELQAEVAEATSLNDYTLNPEQASRSIRLQAGSYPFEILHKERNSNDFFSLVWRRPSGEYLEEITGEYLALPPHSAQVQANVTEFDGSLDYSVYAGSDQTVYFPNPITNLNADVRRRRTATEVSRGWSVVSGPGEVSFSSAESNATTASFTTVGTYVLRFAIASEANAASDDITITVKDELSSKTGFLTRQVWKERFNTLEELRAHSDFPNNPDITTRVTSLAQNDNWSDYYGTRVTGTFVVPPAAGKSLVDYTFSVFGDDAAAFSISTDASAAKLRQVCETTRNTRNGQVRDNSQVSAPVSLVPGRRYFIELVHRELSGSDNYAVAWSTADSPDLTYLSGSMVETPNVGEIHDEDVRFFALAGEDRTYYWPHSETNLDGSHIRVSGPVDNFSSSWYQLSGPEASFSKAMDLQTGVTFSGPGTYVFSLKIKHDGVTHSDDVTITVVEPLENVSGYLTRSLWFDYSGRDFAEIREADPDLAYPHFQDLFPGVETPRAFANFYGTRLEGFLTLPEGGDYVFSLVCDDEGTIEIDYLNGNGYQAVASYNSYAAFRDWRRATTSEPVSLNEGVSYPIRILHKDYATNEHLSIALEGPATNGCEVLSRGFLSPHSDAPLHNPALTVSAGPDQTLLWPQDSLTLASLVYDLEEGPQALAYRWSSSSSEVSITNPENPAASFTFSAPGLYELSLTASDGENKASDTLFVTVQDPLTFNTGTLVREVWNGISGYYVSNLTAHAKYPNEPSFTTRIDSFDAPVNWGENYGQRLRGFLTVPTTGSYELMIASDDQSELWLNANGASTSGMEKIAFAQRATGRYNYERYPEEQISQPIELRAGKRYAIQVLHKEGNSSDYLTVAYRLAGSGNAPSTIPGAFLSPPTDAPPIDEDANGLFINAGPDQQQVWPTNEFTLAGEATDDVTGPQRLSYAWTVLSGAADAVLIHEPSDLATKVTLTAAGNYRLQLTVTDGENVSRDEVTLSLGDAVAAGTGSILAEVYDEITGSRVTDLKASDKFPSAPDRTFRLASTQFADLGDRYGAVLRGYLHPAVTGVHQFNLTSDDWSEAHLSIDDDPENKGLICLVPEGMNYDEWRRHPEYQVSGKIELEAGKRYYLELRHKEHGYRDHLSFAWQQPGEEQFTVIDGAYLSPFDTGDLDAPVITLEGAPALTLQVGSDFVDPGFRATDASQGNLTSNVRTEGTVDTTTAGTYLLRYYVEDEAGNEALVASREIEVVVPNAVAGTYAADASTGISNETYEEPEVISVQDATRFLKQASYGASPSSISRVQSLGYAAWLDEQLAMPFSSHLALMDQHALYEGARNKLLKQSVQDDMMMGMEGMLPGMMMEMETPELETENRLWTWWTLSATADDQLRQRVAFALSQIMVISDYSPALRNYPRGVANYYDILGEYAFGNYRDLMEEVTLNPMMGIFLTRIRSDKEQPDENYAREVMQLFALGLNRLNLDGTPMRDSSGATIPTYGQSEVSELARAITGWTFANSNSFYTTGSGGVNETTPLMAFADYHDRGEKTLVGGATVPGGQTPAEDVSRAMDILFNHPNVAPFVSKQLIQRLVTSNPSPEYIYRVASKFVDNGSGVRGDMAAVVRAVLLDPEARERTNSPLAGKLSEPLLRPLRLMRAFPKAPSSNPPTLGRYMLDGVRYELGQSPMQANSVFNFYEPGYQEPGGIMEAGLVSPEFQITTEITTTNTSNYLYEGVGSGFDTYWVSSGRVGIDRSELLAQWGRPSVLLQVIEDRLLGQPLRSGSREALLEVHAAYESRPEDGVRAILGVVASSPEFSVDR